MSTNVLGIEDEASEGRKIKEYCASHGNIHIDIKDTAEAGLRFLVGQGKISCLVLDMKMPGTTLGVEDPKETGLWIFKRIREVYQLKGLPVIVLSNFVRNGKPHIEFPKDDNLMFLSKGEMSKLPDYLEKYVSSAKTFSLSEIRRDELPDIAPYFIWDAAHDEAVEILFQPTKSTEIRSLLLSAGYADFKTLTSARSVGVDVDLSERLYKVVLANSPDTMLGLFREEGPEMMAWRERTIFESIPTNNRYRGVATAMAVRYLRRYWHQSPNEENPKIPLYVGQPDPIKLASNSEAGKFLARIGFEQTGEDESWIIQSARAESLLKRTSSAAALRDYYRPLRIETSEKMRRSIDCSELQNLRYQK